MELQQKIDEVANLWNKTKDPKYKDEWYKLVKEIASTHGYYNSKRRTLPFGGSYERDDVWDKIIK
jgi:hypothetical protein